MKKSLFAAAVVALALVSCNKKAEEKVEVVEAAADATKEAADAAKEATKEAADATKEAVAK